MHHRSKYKNFRGKKCLLGKRTQATDCEENCKSNQQKSKHFYTENIGNFLIPTIRKQAIQLENW